MQEARFEDHLYYDETSPSCLRWKRDIYSGAGHGILKIKASTPAGSLHTSKKGKKYWKIFLIYKSYLAHRIIWQLFNGKIKGKLKIDHRDTNSLNNKIANLRVVPQKLNTRNGKKRKTNKSGVTGVYFRSFKTSGDYWVATWQSEDGKSSSKAFSINKYGKDAAFNLAVECRKTMIERLNQNGAGYTELHGL